MGDQKESRDEASSSLDPGSEDVKRSRRVAREQADWVKKAAAAVGVAFLVAGVAGFIPGITTNLDAPHALGTRERSRAPRSCSRCRSCTTSCT